MNILIAIALIAGGFASIFYIRTKSQSTAMEMKFMQTKSIEDLKEMFNQMDSNGLGNEYREYVELKGNIVSNELVETPFSNRRVAYCESSLAQVTEQREQYRDSNGNMQTRVNKRENNISNESVVLEINGTGCNLDIPKTFDRFEPKSNLNNYRYFNSFSWNRYGAETLGFKMTEKTINENQSLYVLGEAFRVGDTIHIGKPQDPKKPFIVTTKSEEDFVNKSNQNAKFALIGGIVAIVIGIIFLVKNFM